MPSHWLEILEDDYHRARQTLEFSLQEPASAALSFSKIVASKVLPAKISGLWTRIELEDIHQTFISASEWIPLSRMRTIKGFPFILPAPVVALLDISLGDHNPFVVPARRPKRSNTDASSSTSANLSTSSNTSSSNTNNHTANHIAFVVESGDAAARSPTHPPGLHRRHSSAVPVTAATTAATTAYGAYGLPATTSNGAATLTSLPTAAGVTTTTAAAAAAAGTLRSPADNLRSLPPSGSASSLASSSGASSSSSSSSAMSAVSALSASSAATADTAQTDQTGSTATSSSSRDSRGSSTQRRDSESSLSSSHPSSTSLSAPSPFLRSTSAQSASGLFSPRPRGATATLRFCVEWAKIPHPVKNALHEGGEDRLFVTANQRVLGIADGVGGWRTKSACPDPALYPHLLMHHAKAIAEREQLCDPLTLLQRAYAAMGTTVGSTTACLAALHGSMLLASNLGDSGFLVLRPGHGLLYRSTEQQHYFNCPFQLGQFSSDKPEDAVSVAVPVAAGDIVVLATDGLFDNLFVAEIVEFVLAAQETPLTPSQNGARRGNKTAAGLAALAYKASVQDIGRGKERPFRVNAQRTGIAQHSLTTGKLDDISVLLGYVTYDPVYRHERGFCL